MRLSWRSPVPGDLVWCRFPELPDKAPSPKPPPALILAVETREDGVVVKVVYGTSQRVDRLRTGEFSIVKSRHPDAFALAGLSYDTKFDFKVVVELPWSEAFFKVPPRAAHGPTPKLGTLHPSLMRAAQAAHDAARDRR